jgi:hypothetical protein
MAVIGINYSGTDHDYDDDGNEIKLNPSTFKYESIRLHFGKERLEFKSGNFVKDWYDAKKKYMGIMGEEPYLSASSDVDHFQGDGGKFDSAYLHIENDKAVLKYCSYDDSLDMMETLVANRKIYEDGWEFFVPEGTKPTWEELKEMCK